jgi:CBS domain-containing protein
MVGEQGKYQNGKLIQFLYGNHEMTPSANLLLNYRQAVTQWAPFSGMPEQAIDFFLGRCEQLYFESGEVVTSPSDGVLQRLYLIRTGEIVSTTSAMSGQQVTGSAHHFHAGDFFPLGAYIGERPVAHVYQAKGDTFVLAIDRASVTELTESSPVFSHFLNHRMRQLLDLSRQALSQQFAANALAEQAWERPLSVFVKRLPVYCSAETPLKSALLQMNELNIGCMIVVDEATRPIGILTRHDLLNRVILAGVSLETPMGGLMVQPVVSMDEQETVLDAMLTMSHRRIRHIPVTRAGVLVGVVSERDFFALQQRDIKTVSTGIHSARSIDELVQMSAQTRELAHTLLGQGVQARQLTQLISHLNDLLTKQLIGLLAQAYEVNAAHYCWLSLGSEGREEQTIATDQDNAMVVSDSCSDDDKANLRAFAKAVNLGLDRCGFPLCKGGIMAGEEKCFKTAHDWVAQFAHWQNQGSPEDLLNASIFFDCRPIAGNEALAEGLLTQIAASASIPRFLKQLTSNALTRSPGLNWLGRFATDKDGQLDLKLQGTAVAVDAARILSLAAHTGQTNTRQRLESVGEHLQAKRTDIDNWIDAFEFLQMLRLRMQIESVGKGHNPNAVQVDALRDIDQRILKVSLRSLQNMQTHLELDYQR